MTGMSIKHWEDPVNLILGLWLVISPWVLGFQNELNPMWSMVILGALIGLIAVVAVFRVMAWEEWANLLLGLGVAVSPWILGFSGVVLAMWNALLVGAVVAALALWALGTDKDIGGWWSHAT